MGRDVSEKTYRREMRALQLEVAKLQRFVRSSGKRVVLIFEGRDAAGKGGTIARLTQYLDPRWVRTVALQKPSERERGQWYFQRYVQHLPAAGEIVCFDRSWYNRAVVEPALGFCTEAEHDAFLTATVPFERLLVEDGILLAKYWLSISEHEQEARLDARESSPLLSWKLSATDRLAHDRWDDLTRYKREMYERTHTEHAPWTIVRGDQKKAARLALLRHLLTLVDYPDKGAKGLDLVPGPLVTPPF